MFVLPQSNCNSFILIILCNLDNWCNTEVYHVHVTDIMVNIINYAYVGLSGPM